MKIQKFNENKQNWTIDRVNNNISETENLKELFTKYILWKNENLEHKNCVIKDFYSNNKSTISIVYKSDDNFYNVVYQVEDVNELIEFLNNPDIVKNTNKYNI